MVTDSDRVRAYYDSDAYLARNVIVPIRARLVRELLHNVCCSTVLDLGCGDGSISRPLLASGNRLTLVDFSAGMLERAKRAMPPNADVEFVKSDIADYDSPGGFDVVICVGVLAHVPSPADTIGSVARLLRPGGQCVLQISDDGVPLGWLLNRFYFWRRNEGWKLNVMTHRQVCSIAAQHGLHEVDRRRYGLLLPGSGRLPYSTRRRIESSAAAPPFSHLGSQALIVFRRDQSEAAAPIATSAPSGFSEERSS